MDARSPVPATTRPDHDVNDYSLDRMPWISHALGRAKTWARRR